MKKTGGEGGCEATIIGKIEQEDYDGKSFPLIKETHQVDYPLNSRYYDEQEKKKGQYKAHILFNGEWGNAPSLQECGQQSFCTQRKN